MFAKKSLGQNFLKVPSVVETMLDVAQISNDDTILEIGPGNGIITQELLARASHIVALELDDRLIQHLQKKFFKEIAQERFTLIHCDALLFDPTPVATFTGHYKIVANIPYYITGHFLRRYLSQIKQPQSLTLLVQKEVAERIVSQDKKASLLSLSVQAYGRAKLVRVIPKSAFAPEPKVDSAILHIDIEGRNFDSFLHEESFFSLIHSGFAHKRKQLASNLKQSHSKIPWTDIFSHHNLRHDIRAEDLSFTQWKILSRQLLV